MKKLTYVQADTFQYFLTELPGVSEAVVYERTADASVKFSGRREDIIDAVRRFHFEEFQAPEAVTSNSGRELNAYYKEKLITKICLRCLKKLFVPIPIRTAITVIKSIRYIGKGINSLIHKKLDVPVLDAVAIAVSIIRQDFSTASSVMFLLGIGEIMEEWTHKKSVNDLAQSMALNIGKVWLKTEDSEILIPAKDVQPGDSIVVHMGNVIPFDGDVLSGEGMVNQSSLTGEPLAVRRTEGGYVYAGTVLEDGELIIKVRESNGSSRYEKIISVIEETEKLKSERESKTEHIADSLVPYTLGGTLIAWLLTRNVTKALSILMVDFSCALKLAMPITVLSAIKQARDEHISVKGGKFLEDVSAATTIVFDKTGTLTKATPVVKDVVPFGGRNKDEMLRMAACLEEHFPHSLAKAVVKAAQEKALAHEEMHSTIEYVVAHGISSYINDQKVIIGSGHFVFEDEKCEVTSEEREKLNAIPEHYSRLFMSVDKRLAAVICIEDPVREEAVDVISELKKAGFEKIVMMTGDSKKTAARVAENLGLDEYYAEVLPEQKADFIKAEKDRGKKVIMIGDGVNDSPALSAADVGIAISDGAEIAREIADITISANDLYSIVTLKKLSNAMIKRIHSNYRLIVGINGALIIGGVAGFIAPATSATLHNLSTIGISLKSMSKLDDE